jgi:hypothetical protein
VSVTAERPIASSRASRRRRDLPWSAPQLRIAVLGGILGGILLAISYLGAAGSSDVATQLGWLALSIVGLLVLASGGGSLLLYGHRAVHHRWAQLARTRGHRPATRRRRQEFSTADPVNDRCWVPRTQRIHRTTCQLVLGKSVEPLTSAEAEERGLVRCEVCAP